MLIPPILKVVLNSHLILYTGHRAPATFNLKMVNAIIPGGGYTWEFLVGVCRPVLQILTLFQTENCHFLHPFSDLVSKKLCHHHYLGLECQ